MLEYCRQSRDTHRQTKHFLIGGSSLLDGGVLRQVRGLAENCGRQR